MFGHSLLQTLMPLGSEAYVPSLRWRQAEYQALLRLDESIKDRIVPLITIPPIEFDFEAEYLRKQCTSMYILSSRGMRRSGAAGLRGWRWMSRSRVVV